MYFAFKNYSYFFKALSNYSFIHLVYATRFILISSQKSDEIDIIIFMKSRRTLRLHLSQYPMGQQVVHRKNYVQNMVLLTTDPFTYLAHSINWLYLFTDGHHLRHVDSKVGQRSMWQMVVPLLSFTFRLVPPFPSTKPVPAGPSHQLQVGYIYEAFVSGDKQQQESHYGLPETSQNIRFQCSTSFWGS